MKKKIFDQFSDVRLHQQVSSLYITSNYMGADILMIIFVMNSIEETSNSSTGTPNVAEGCCKETPGQ